MARGGINKAVVQTARLAILARGENPSIDAVRIEMGNTGSKTTIHRYLKELDESETRQTITQAPIDDELGELVARLSQRLKEKAQEPIDLALAQFEQQKAALLAQVETLEEAHTQLKQQFDIQAAALAEESAALQTASTSLQTEQTRNAGLSQACSDYELRLNDKTSRFAHWKKNTCTPAMRLSITALPSRSSVNRNSVAMRASCNRYRPNCVRHSKALWCARTKSPNCIATTSAC